MRSSTFPLDRTFISAVVLAIIPLSLLTAIIYIFAGTGICSKQVVWSDENIHWAQAASFVEVGFNGGYFNWNENPPIIEQINTYVWGPAPTIFYGTIGSLVGFQFCTPILINLILLGVSIFIFTLILRPNWKQTALLAILIITYPSLFLYSPMVMLQVPNIAISVFLASLVIHLIRQNQLTTIHIAVASGIIFLASLFRVSWSFFIIPLYLMFILEKISVKRFIISSFVAIALIIGMLILNTLITAPFPNVFSAIIEQFSLGMNEGFTALFHNIRLNFALLRIGNIAHHILRLQMLIIIIVTLMTIRKYVKNKDLHVPAMKFANWHIMNLSMIFVFVVLVYDMYDWRDFRLFAPVVFFSFLLLIAEKKWYLVIILFLISFPSYNIIFPMYQNILNTHFNEENSYTTELIENEQILRDLSVIYDELAPNRWCNSVLHSSGLHGDQELLLAFDDPMGLVLLTEISEYNSPIKSQYILLIDSVVIPEHWMLEEIQQFDLPSYTAILYLNLDADC